MFLDLTKDKPATKPPPYDVCVCGAGVAGITTARELARAGKKVALFEGGGRAYTDQSQAIYEGKSIGRTFYGLTLCRVRYLGGTSNHWAGLCRPLESVTFEERDYLGLPGWPIPKSELDQHLSAASAILDLGDQDFKGQPHAEWNSSTFQIAGFALSRPPTRFGEKFHDELFKSDNIDLFLNANVTDIRLSKSLDHVSEITVSNYNNDAYSFSAKQFVICFGGIENARILLNSASQIPTGIGNQSDFVGRCFMEHLNVDIGRFVSDRKTGFWNVPGFAIEPTRDFQRKMRVSNAVINFNPSTRAETYGRLRELKRFVRDNVCRSDTLVDLTRKFVHFHCPGDGVIDTMVEQSPNRDSRITLSGERDALGLRRVNVNLQINDLDRRTIRTLAIEAAKELARLDLARVQFVKAIYNEEIDLVTDQHCHHMGTTRMAASPRHGVVDKNSKVFGVDNLYIGGSSVFSTGGASNPTLTIVQLALRLSEHLKTML
jgi:choline dehydrogenase-like flavoprotein